MTFKASVAPSLVTIKARSLRYLFIAIVLASTLFLSTTYVNTPRQTTTSCDGRSALFDSFKHAFQKVRSVVNFSGFRSRSRLILLWTSYFSKENWLPKLEDIGCSLNCFITSNRNLLNKSDAVVFHLRDVKISDLPPRGDERQLWVLFNKEAPPHTPVDIIRALEGKIHWTATYRKDSDIYAPYGKIARKKKNFCQHRNENQGHYEWEEGKKSLVCWVVSNCVTPSQREQYVDELRRHIPVHVYGKCSEKPCPRKDVLECYAELSKRCMFYLSFENSLCTDYTTEKLYYALRTGMVPIVMSGDSSFGSLPNHSYINALDYEDPKDLASLLLELAEDISKYKAYLEWHQEYEVQDTSYKWACDLCKKLHDLQSASNAHSNLASWWFENGSCYSWLEYSNIFS